MSKAFCLSVAYNNADLKYRHDATIRAIVKKHGGKEINSGLFPMSREREIDAAFWNEKKVLLTHKELSRNPDFHLTRYRDVPTGPNPTIAKRIKQKIAAGR